MEENDMNLEKEVLKAQKKRDFLKFLDKSFTFLLKVLLFPVYFYALWRRKHPKKVKTTKASEEQIKKFVDKVLPTMLEIGEKFVCIHDYNDDFDYAFLSFQAMSYAGTPRLRRKYNYPDRNQISSFVRNKYEIDGYEKLTINSWVEWESACRQFGFKRNWNSDYDKGVVFYKKEDLAG